ncbi:MAG TPA: secretion protein HlyD [Planctomycetales bacterium]|jgi:HlyD family secretion protein|nr:secretion protein HlyD [Planctomycetales bacterium]
MSTINAAERSPSADGSPSANGSSLRDRVRSLRLSERVPEGKRASFAAVLLPWGLCVILLAVTAAFGYRAYTTAPTEAPSQTADSTKKDGAAPGVTGDMASSGDVALEAKGYIIPVHQIQVSPKVSGMLTWIDPRLEEGQRFKEGAPLARIEDVNYRADFMHAKYALASAEQRYQQSLSNRPEEIDQSKADLAESEATLEQLKLEMQRSTRLLGTPALAAKDFEQDKFAYAAMNRHVARLKATLKLMEEGPRKEVQEAAKADVEAAKADLDKAKWNLDNCEIQAPVSGTILKKGAEKGNIVNPIAFNISSSLCDMADLSDLEVDLKIQERDIAKVAKGMACTAMPEAYQSDAVFLKIHPKGYIGKVSRLMPTADRGQGAIPVRVKLDIPKEEEGVYLKPDLSVIVEFLKDSTK